jgi:DNA invertase Pin-like site-specific DNA recombinase
MTDRAYARISLDTERSASISKQRTSLTKFASSDVVFYVDESVSGSKIAFGDRPEGKRLLADLRSGDRVLFTKIDRAARNVPDLLNLVKHIDSIGASVVFVEQNIDTSGAIGKFILVLLAAIAELEADIIGERRRESLEVMKKDGRHAVGAAPYGFLSADNPNGRGLVIRPHPEDGPLVREAILGLLEGKSIKDALETLDISRSGFRHLLNNPRLAGMTPEHTYETYTTTRGKEQHRVKESGVVMIDGTPRIDPDAALLTMSEWTALQELLDGRKGQGWESAPGYGAALSCSVCGQRLYLHASDNKPGGSYACVRERHEPGQAGVSISRGKADKYVEEKFLSEHGERPYKVAKVIEDSAERLEAISMAKVSLLEAEKAMRVAEDEKAEDAAFAGIRAAKRAVKDAEAMPSNRRVEMTESGETVQDVWEAADDTERCEMLRSAATWNVLPGNMAAALKFVTTERKTAAPIARRGKRVRVQIPGGPLPQSPPPLRLV